jgi:hypothetical protein
MRLITGGGFGETGSAVFLFDESYGQRKYILLDMRSGSIDLNCTEWEIAGKRDGLKRVGHPCQDARPIRASRAFVLMLLRVWYGRLFVFFVGGNFTEQKSS